MLASEYRTKIYNLDADKGILLQYEPPNLTGNVRANMGGEPGLAQPHSQMVYGNTDSEVFPIEMRWERIPLQSFKGISPDAAADIIDKHRAFIRSLIVPNLRPAGVTGGDLPLLFVEVPGVYAVYCQMASIDWDVMRRDPTTGRIVSLKMRCSFREKPQYWYSQQEIEVLGYNRG